jgi:hypothetical protein
MMAAMPTCPVCENAQPSGEECDVCGRPFPRGERVPAPVEAVPGLEPTRFEAAGGAGDPLEGLEPTRLEAGEVDVVAIPAAEMEPTRIPGVNAPATEIVEGLEPTRADGPAGDPVAASAARSCRYCRTPAPPTDAFCSRCGMRLAEVAGAVRRDEGLGAVLCPGCGTPIRGEACPSCGARRS